MMARITLANHGDAGLVEVKTVYHDAYTEGGIYVREGACDRIARGIKEGGGKRPDKDGGIEPRKPGSFVGKPDFSLYFDGGRDLAGYADVWGERLD
jgi:hypothetical protein